MELRPLQAIALYEMGINGGALLPIRVGGGKTLISLLAGRMFEHCRRPLLVIPAALKDKTFREEKVLRRHWVLPAHIKTISYTALSRERFATFLDTDYRPDVIIADECHKLANQKSGCTRRIHRYLKANPGVAFVGMSGTINKASLKDFARLAFWALRNRSPLPNNWYETLQGSLAEDGGVKKDRRLAVGALSKLGDGRNAREIVRDRLIETPGFVASSDGPLDVPLHITSRLVDSPLQKEFSDLRSKWETPEGIECTDGIEVWRHARELGVGCYYRWNPPPPEAWKAARSVWARACRETIQNGRRNIDTELQLKLHIRDNPTHYPEAKEALEEWEAIQPSYDPTVEAVWLTDEIEKQVLEWARVSPGLVWTGIRFFAERLSNRLPYYGSQGIDSKTGRVIEDHPPNKGSAVVSIAANSTGRNLQAWNRNLVVGMPTNGKAWEQLLGRTHRDGQRNPVSVEVWFTCREDLDGFWKAVDQARYIEQVTGQCQKLTYATKNVHKEIEKELPQWVTGMTLTV